MLKTLTLTAAALVAGWTAVCGPAAARVHLEAATDAPSDALSLGDLIALRGAVEAGDEARVAVLTAEVASVEAAALASIAR